MNRPAAIHVPQATSWEMTRRALHTAIDWACYAWPKAVNDARSVGYPASVRPPDGRGGGELDYPDPTGSTALQDGQAAGWIAQLGDLVVRLLTHPLEPSAPQRPWTPTTACQPLHTAIEKLCHDWPPDAEHITRTVIDLGNQAHAWWPPPPKPGQLIEGVTIGQRTNTIETCHLCQQPVAGGHTDPIRRIDGDPYHAKSCWFTVTRHRTPKTHA